MNISRTLWPGLTVAVLMLGATVQAETIRLKLLSSGAVSKLHYYMPQNLTLSENKPVGLKKAPEDLISPLYGVLKLGGKSILLIVDEPVGKPVRLFVDSNSNGDLTDDTTPEWKAQDSGDGQKTYDGGATVQLKIGEKPVSLHLGLYRFVKKDAPRAKVNETLHYYSDYAYEGEIKLGDQTYNVMLADEMATGDFRGKKEAESSGVRLLIDVNHNGRFDRRGEKYDILKPFNIKGTTYEITNMSILGDKFDIVKSDKTVAEIPAQPDLIAGQNALAFETKTSDGLPVKFPDNYKGKLVMLDFWATWCVPCVGEMPHLTKAYETYHDKGFEVLGISLDQENAAAKLASFTKEHNMPWRQVYDGKFWEAEIAKLYMITSIPQAFLIDGDTGKIVAEGASLRGDELDKTIKAALDKKEQK